MGDAPIKMIMWVPDRLEFVQNADGIIIGVAPWSYPFIAMEGLVLVAGAEIKINGVAPNDNEEGAK